MCLLFIKRLNYLIVVFILKRKIKKLIYFFVDLNFVVCLVFKKMCLENFRMIYVYVWYLFFFMFYVFNILKRKFVKVFIYIVLNIIDIILSGIS